MHLYSMVSLSSKFRQSTKPNLSNLTRLAVQSLGELVDCRGNLQTLVQNGALPLQANITRPFHKACQVTLWLNILACGQTNKKVLLPTVQSIICFVTYI